MSVESTLLWLLSALACARITRLVTDDHWPPTTWLRQSIRRRFGPESSWFILAVCMWCLGAWVTSAVYAWEWYLLSIPYPLLQIPAASMVVGMLGTRFSE